MDGVLTRPCKWAISVVYKVIDRGFMSKLAFVSMRCHLVNCKVYGLKLASHGLSDGVFSLIVCSVVACSPKAES